MAKHWCIKPEGFDSLHGRGGSEHRLRARSAANGNRSALVIGIKPIGGSHALPQIGKTGIKVSEIALGAWVTFGNQLEQKSASDLIHAAYDQGVNFFDNADVYAMGKAEEMMGKAIKDLPRDGLGAFFSKVFWPTLTGSTGVDFPASISLNRCMLSLQAFAGWITWISITATATIRIHRWKKWSSAWTASSARVR